MLFIVFLDFLQCPKSPLTIKNDLQAALWKTQLRSEAFQRMLLIVTRVGHSQRLQSPVQVSVNGWKMFDETLSNQQILFKLPEKKACIVAVNY